MLDRKISLFSSIKQTKVSSEPTVKQSLEWIRDGKFKDLVEKVREGDKEAKKMLPAIAFQGLFDQFRKKESFYEASGIVIVDIDDVPKSEIEEYKADIADSYENVLAVMVSPSGNGIKVLYLIEQELITAESYSLIQRKIAPDFSVYGDVDILSVTDCLIATYDPNIIINEEAFPRLIYIEEIKKKEGKLEELDKKKPLWEDPEDFFDTVLFKSIEEKTNNNYHFIQVSLLDLSRFGFTHPKYDLSFVIDYSENVFGSSSKNKQRFVEAAAIASQYPQLNWPYRIVRDDWEEDDEYIDYSTLSYGEDDKKEKDNKKVSKKKVSEEEDENDSDSDLEKNVINYSKIFGSVLETISEGDRVGAEISFKNFADIFRFKGTGILTVTGIPSHGKTEWVDAMLIDLARLHHHHAIFVGFEQTVEEHVIKLMRKIAGKNITCPTYFKDKSNSKHIKSLYLSVAKYFNHIDTRKTGGNINVLLKTATLLIKKEREKGNDMRYLVLDPFNMLSIKGGRLSNLEKIEEILRRLTHFSHQMDVLVILVAHPYKLRKDEKTGAYPVPDFYSVKGSSAFFEMSFSGLVVYRTGYQPNDPMFVRVLKLKQNNLGIIGDQAYFNYDKDSGRYIPIDEEGNELEGDHREKYWKM